MTQSNLAIQDIIDIDYATDDDLEDFLNMKNEEFKQLAHASYPFSVCLMNPPYATTGNDVIHLKFVEKCLDLSQKQVSIFPFTFITKVHNKQFEKYKKQFNDYIVDIEEVGSETFQSTKMPNVAIYTLDNNKKNDYIEIKPINGEQYKITSLIEMSEFSEYEKHIVKYLSEQGQVLGTWCGGTNKRKSELDKIPSYKHKEFLDNKVIKNCENACKYINDGYVALIVSNAGGMDGKAFSSRNGQIFDNADDLIKYFLDAWVTNGHNVLLVKSMKEAENLRDAIKRPLLRFTIYRTQDDQHITYKKCYKYIPNIDWADDRTKTDEGILMMCGCPKEKAAEYAAYCKDIIDKVDKK